jgi:nicotinamide mononucleotide transporter
MLSIALEVGKVQITWLEALAFVLALACVVYNVLEVHWGWPLAIVSSALYGWLFFHSKLYGDAGIQIYFVIASFWGWWQWLYGHRSDSKAIQVRGWSARERQAVVLSWAGLWVILGLLLGRFTDTDVPWADAFPTAGSFIGQILLGKKIRQNWLVWQVVNVCMVGLLAYKALWLTVLLYLIFLGMAVLGWRRWSRLSA